MSSLGRSGSVGLCPQTIVGVVLVSTSSAFAHCIAGELSAQRHRDASMLPYTLSAQDCDKLTNDSELYRGFGLQFDRSVAGQVAVWA